MRFADKVVLVSGAGSGIGRATATAFAAEGASVALLGRSADKLEETASQLPHGRGLPLDARHEDPEEAAAAVRRTIRELGRLDILVNNAGEFSTGSAAETTIEEWNRALAVNLTGAFLLTREALPHLRRGQNSAVVNVASTLGLKPVAGTVPYSVAKAGLILLTRATALEEAANGVRANVVCPGVVDTPIHSQRVGDDPARHHAFLQEMAKLHPLGRVGRAEEIAALILFLASDASTWTTGAVVTIDGGISLS